MQVKQLQIRYSALLVVLVLLLTMTAIPAQAEEGDKTYTVTANLFVPGELNTQLPGVTAYMTNGNNPLGIGGYEAVAPTTPVSDNATLSIASDGTMTLSVKILNPVFTLQKIGECSNASIIDAPKNSEVYATQDGTVSRTGRITSLNVTLNDRTGSYVFNDCLEFPTLLGVDWSVPLTLSVDLSSVPSDNASVVEKTPKNNTVVAVASVNLDALKAIVSTAGKVISAANVSADGADVDSRKVWVTQENYDILNTEIAKGKATLSATDQKTIDSATAALTTAYKTFVKGEKSGSMLTEENSVGKPGTGLTAGTYTVSCNIWFNKVDTGLPLNPHITNSTFPPYNPVVGNATLVVAEDETAKVIIPVVIQDKVMTIRALTGLDFIDVKTNESGAIISASVNLGQLATDYTVITKTCMADIQMGDLAMSISGLEQNHTWPATFELNLSGAATKDGGVMPTVEVEMMNASDATDVMASVKGEATQDQSAESEKSQGSQQEISSTTNVGTVIIVVIATAGIVLVKKRKRGGKSK